MTTFIFHFTHFQYPQHEEANKYNKHKPHSHTQPPLHHCDSAHTYTVFYSILEEPTIATSATTQHLVLNRKPFAESLKSSSEMSLVHPQVREFFENWHRPAFSKWNMPRFFFFWKVTCQEYIVIINNLDFVQLAKLFEVGEPVPFRCLPVSWSLMYKVSSTRFAVSLGRSLVFLSFRYKERWFPSQDGYIMIFLQNRKHRTILEFLESRN